MVSWIQFSNPILESKIKTKNGVRTGMCQPLKTISDIRIKLAADECPSRHLWDFQEGEVCFHIIFLKMGYANGRPRQLPMQPEHLDRPLP